MADTQGESSTQQRVTRPRRKRAADVDNDEPEASTAVIADEKQAKPRAVKVARTQVTEEEDVAKQRLKLRKVAQETKGIIPFILTLMPQAPPDATYYSTIGVPPLDRKYCPKVQTLVKVVEGDTFDTAINLANAAQFLNHKDTTPVCVLNMANATHLGGGWEGGVMAQEEALCFRSSLSATLNPDFYPMEPLGAVYSPSVVIFRENVLKDHRWMDLGKTEWLPIVSIISMAAMIQPSLDETVKPPKYKNQKDRELTKGKMRLVLRMAAIHNHRRLVLGALGCGVLRHPKEEVAHCWLEVLQETEFKEWFEAIVFAVYDGPQQKALGIGNFRTFHEILDGAQL
ncbi:uncharacterized protein ACLA_050980 [Aspergillus clavatus NRRL 1]|uniref:Microbial-type PARG catalytic domain-containing protein n=1 Tax=Aspergillus clavatus (strain ATCC 1007 / CBS 513.65 / DSM 816 / NCTC 3887 / NRRL 1 / QM 1276 / 107) TaxID=344612 RepID=A1CIC1_ASPCL|nr:uncharacterized protein ACLA_050980 [Aspergillus clavatus NRRL 1]EAW10626.1 conserved hypothetical protein [Aspergillus clavatus NRRL 1]